MPQGPGTYGSKAGRPKKKKSKGMMNGGSVMLPSSGKVSRNDLLRAGGMKHGGEVRAGDVRDSKTRGKTY
jgi:hypothetical protein